MSAKNLILRPIPAADANALVKRLHYSGKVVQNSQFHIGVFWQGTLEGALQFGPSLDKPRTRGLVRGTAWNGFTELNRLAFSPALPRNSESRALGVAMRLLRAHAPSVRWVISFADAVQCGDGTIYRASGFVLTGIKANRQIMEWRGLRIAKRTLDDHKIGGRYASGVLLKNGEASWLPGFQLRYIRFLDPTWRARLTVPEIPFSRIREVGASMYRGRSAENGTAANQPQGAV